MVPITIPIVKICRLESGFGVAVPFGVLVAPGFEIIVVGVVSPDMIIDDEEEKIMSSVGSVVD